MGIKRRLKKYLKKHLIGETVVNKPPFLISNSEFLTAGIESYHNGSFIVRGQGIIKVGNYCAFGRNITLIKSNHNYNFPSIQYTFYRNNFKELPYEIQDSNHLSITIGHDVWIGDNVTILPGVKIGNGACIGAGSVVSKDVEHYAIYAGVPAKKIKNRFNEETILYLENLEWWHMSKSEIEKNKSLFFTDLNLNPIKSEV